MLLTWFLRTAVAVFMLIPALAVVTPVSGQEKPDKIKPADELVPPREGSTGDAEHGFIEFRLGYYDVDDSGDGNPFLDEDLQIIEPIIVYDYNYNDRLGYNLKFSYDSVSSASIDRLSSFPEQSGATGDNYFGLEGSFRYKLSETLRYGAFFHASTEYDYNSLGIGGHVERDLANMNATVRFSLNGFLDDIDVIRGASKMGMQEGNEDRTTISSTLKWYQVIDPRTHGELGTTLTFQDGFLETPYNDVLIEDPTLPPIPTLENARGTAVTEELDNSRYRYALFGKIQRYFDPGFSLELGGRFYTDSWGITSFTLGPQAYTWLVKDELRLRLSYRYYTQTDADDYSEHFFVLKNQRTQDSDLADFDAHTIGTKLDWYVSERWKLDTGIDYTVRSDGLDQIYLSFGLRYDF